MRPFVQSLSFDSEHRLSYTVGQMSLIERIGAKARDLGFDLVGIAPAHPIPHLDAYRAWLSQGYHGEMAYMARADRVKRREHPERIMPGVQSIVCVGMNYYPGEWPDADPSRGLISRYAWGADYHDLMTPRLEELAAFIHAQTGGRAAGRVYVDTGPVLERSYAAAAGLGFIGKNTCLIHPRLGSWLFLGEILLDMEIGQDGISPHGGCGTCTRCLEACPTGALVAPYVLDARRCISYLTIELKGAIPVELRPLLDNRIYGCDVCQEVCPWQRFARPTQEQALRAADADHAAPSLLALIALDEEGFRRRYTGSPIARIGRGRFLRNVAVALGNRGDRQAIPALEKALSDDDPLIQEHAAWALEHINARENARRPVLHHSAL